jgi:hypothetical protein
VSVVACPWGAGIIFRKVLAEVLHIAIQVLDDDAADLPVNG